MNELQMIDQREILGKTFRIFGTIENPLFVAQDVAGWIEHSNVTEMTRSIDDAEKLNSTILSAGQNREVTMLTEDGLYEVLMQSRKPIAKMFKKQVKDILRSIRKNGAYMTPDTLEKALTSPDFLIQLATKLKEEQTARIEAESKLAIAAPKAETLDTIATDEGFLLTVGEMAKTIAMPGLNETEVRKILRNADILCATKNEITADAIRKGYGRMIVEEVYLGGRKFKAVSVPKFRGKTLDLVARTWKQNANLF